jgi:hypothetical protein
MLPLMLPRPVEKFRRLSRFHKCHLMAAALLVMLLITSCASSKKRGHEKAGSQPPAANDWTTEYLGKGPVKTTITNASGNSLFLKVEQSEATVAQVKIEGQGIRSVFLARGQYGVKIKIGTQAYRSPGFSIPPNTAGIHLTLKAANTTNLRRISEAEFAR